MLCASVSAWVCTYKTWRVCLLYVGKGVSVKLSRGTLVCLHSWLGGNASKNTPRCLMFKLTSLFEDFVESCNSIYVCTRGRCVNHMTPPISSEAMQLRSEVTRGSCEYVCVIAAEAAAALQGLFHTAVGSNTAAAWDEIHTPFLRNQLAQRIQMQHSIYR